MVCIVVFGDMYLFVAVCSCMYWGVVVGCVA